MVGAGPAGASLALLLARRGLAVDLIDATGRGGRPFRGEGLMPSGLAALAAMGLEPLPAAVRRRPLTAWSFFLDGQALFEAAEPMGSSVPCTLIDQDSLIAKLLEQAGRQPGFRFHPGQAASDLLLRDGRVAGVRLTDGTALEAELVVACDGRDSLLRRRGGLELESAPSPLDVLWFRLESPGAAGVLDWLAGRFVTVVGASGSYALFPSARGGVQLGWAVAPAPGPAGPAGPAAWAELWANDAPEALARLLRELPAAAVQGPVRLPVRVGLCPRWQRPGLLLLGDAAHPMSPLRAQGINMALRDALVAARHLGPALLDGDPGAIDAAAAAVVAERRPEIRRIQALQEQEARRADLLRRRHRLRGLLARTARWSGPLLARRWLASQRPLRDGTAAIARDPGAAAMIG
ncbi:2-polyprenyl-6-methoxyphenol hydroxylase-like oxidoreductase [Cyanobium gracile PCC 6307]|uniref:2-polyprenyl-6-methoxyphenol hydroxylase-like oxidoreductase n=1 Tax=Cyanobium gracile (strain ATCC 27147 / PCC 6307) TaxID=292564 RepID=K9P6F4_CYAGP|nr:2-polyprenyl-6-methoxyphenol hydroxylase-like oxidoreductase [Cyanobium gracile PCC 6307]